MREIHPVIFHRPGPGWDHALPMFEQDGLQAHLDHYRGLQARGLMAQGGPFMDGGSGGMMIGKPSLSMDEAQRIAAEDPCVMSGLLLAEVRPWYQAMKS
jgi:uncharacterized protein YciI